MHLHYNPELIIHLLIFVKVSSKEADNVWMVRMVVKYIHLGLDILLFV